MQQLHYLFPSSLPACGDLYVSVCEGLLIVEIKQITPMFNLESAEICCCLQGQALQFVFSSLETSAFNMLN